MSFATVAALVGLPGSRTGAASAAESAAFCTWTADTYHNPMLTHRAVIVTKANRSSANHTRTTPALARSVPLLGSITVIPGSWRPVEARAGRPCCRSGSGRAEEPGQHVVADLEVDAQGVGARADTAATALREPAPEAGQVSWSLIQLAPSQWKRTHVPQVVKLPESGLPSEAAL